MQCRICLDVIHGDDYTSPCKCSGTLQYVHRSCFKRWLQERIRQNLPFQCEICHYLYLDEVSRNGYSFIQYLTECFNLKEANRNIINLLIITIHLYLFYYIILSGTFLIILHDGQVSHMDFFIWGKSETYVVICVDRNCRCQTKFPRGENNSRWEHHCEYWNDKSVFIFSRITFLIFDSDFDQNNDFINEVNINIFRVIVNYFDEKPFRLQWKTPYNGTILATIKWTSNLISFLTL